MRVSPRLLALVLAAWLVLPACTAQARLPESAAQAVAGLPVAVRAKAVALDQDDLQRRTVGRLRFLGCLNLSSHDPRFGGFSGLMVSDDGSRLVAVSDHGWWLTMGLQYATDGRLAGVDSAVMGRIMTPDGRPLPPIKRRSDAEELAPGPKGGIIVSFERDHRLWLYPGRTPTKRPTPLALPSWLKDAPHNGGVEAMARLADGRLFLLAEGLRQDGRALGALGGPDGWSKLWYRMAGEQRPTAACLLPGGDLAVLERSWSMAAGVTIRLSRVGAAQIKPNARLAPEELAVLREPLAVDNLEGLAARRDAQGRTLLYMLSDDNYNPAQRTLLMLWELR